MEFFRRVVCACVAVMAVAALADPAVAITSVAASASGGGLVDVAYTVSGRGADEDAAWQLAFTFGSVVASNFTDYAWCDLPVANGAHTVTWDSKADGVETPDLENYSGAFVAANATKADADYMIVDVSSGKDSTVYPVRFARAGANVTTRQFNKSAYKLHKIAFKKVTVGDFFLLTNATTQAEEPYTFRMGDCNTATSKTGWYPVRLTKNYFLGIFELTQQQYVDVVGSNPSKFTTKETALDSIKAEITDYTMHPVEQVVYNTMATEGTGLFSRMTTRSQFAGSAVGTIGAPTEAQWEYACRAGTTTKYHWGADANTAEGYLVEDEYAWHNFTSNPYGGVSKCHHGVGELKPNDWGFYDMAGNVYENCSDWYGNYPSASSVTTDPTGAASGTAHPIRGGGWSWEWYRLASGYRESQSAADCGGGWSDGCSPTRGIRLGMTVE